MAEYIEKEKFIKWVDDTYCKPCEEAKRDYNHFRCGSCQYDDMMCDVESFESADVAPVRHGRWIKDSDGLTICSECEEVALQRVFIKLPEKIVDLQMQKSHYCPNCGAKMDLEE